MIRPLALPVLLFAALSSFAETSENFNSRKGVPINRLLSSLHNSCWTFHHFDVNKDGWNPGIEGDGAMVSDGDALGRNYSGIYTPVLNINSTIDVSFDYVFNANFSSSAKRWIKICLADGNNDIVRVLEVLNINGNRAKSAKKFQGSYSGIKPGEYRVILQYGGSGETARIAIDGLELSASLMYPGGCGAAPVARRAKVTGKPDRTAYGSLLLNDKGVTDANLSAYLIKGSAHGDITLEEDGTFVFKPKTGLEGLSTSFIYKVCDNSSSLCSGNTTIYIDFPASSVSLTDFKGSYKYNGLVELGWNTRAGSSTKRFDLERSLNGEDWQKAGTVEAKPGAGPYVFTDNVGKGTAHRKDLYYRLKQTDEEGNVLTSRMLIVRVYNTKTLTMISVTPNPSKDDITANVQLLEDSYVSMRILNSSGASVIHRTVEGTRGLNTFAVEGSSALQPGAYMLELIVNSKERMMVKLIKE